MRYLDWDVLLFPKESHPSAARQVPIREFKTACYAIQEGHHVQDTHHHLASPSPLIMCFVPSLDRLAQFYISVHSWSDIAKQFPAAGNDNQHAPRMWQLRVVINGECKVELVHADITWPHMIGHDSFQSDQANVKLCFPGFKKSTADARFFSPADDIGRIKVEINAGFLVPVDDESSTFWKLSKIVTFAFVHAPLSRLEICGIAWPNPAMWNNPIFLPAMNQISRASRARMLSESRDQSVDNNTSSATRQLPQPPLSTPAASHKRPFNESASMETSCYDLSELPKDSFRDPGYGSIETPSMQELRNRIVQSYDKFAPAENMQRGSGSSNMPPPPLPASRRSTRHAQVEHRDESSENIDTSLSNAVALHQDSSLDTSMHTGCQDFPACTSEDEQGQTHHSSLEPPATVIRSRKHTKRFEIDLDSEI